MQTRFGNFSEYEGYGDYGDFWSTISAPIKNLVSGVGSVIHKVAKEAGRTVVVKAIAKTSIGKELERVGDRIDRGVVRPGVAALTSGDLLKAFSFLNPFTAIAMTVSDSHVSDVVKALYPPAALTIQDPELKHAVIGAYAIAACVAAAIFAAGAGASTAITTSVASSGTATGAGAGAGAGATIGTGAGGLTAAQIASGVGVASSAVGLAKTTGLIPVSASSKERSPVSSQPSTLTQQELGITDSPYFLPVAVGGGAILILGAIFLAAKK
jgi:hypothetical protein